MQFRNFDTSFFLLALAIAGLVTGLAVYGRRRRRRMLAAFATPALLPRLTTTLDGAKRRLRLGLWAVGLLLLLGAMARPWWGSQLMPAQKHSRDLIFVVDCSRSMLAKDVPPSRLDHAKWWVRQLVSQCPGDRFGLIAFAGDAFLECPLTQDVNTIYQFLDACDTRTVAAGGTNIAAALETAHKAFKAAEGSHHALVVITDGDELEGDAKAAVKYYVDNKVPLFVVGIGDPDRGSMIQLEDNSFLRDANGAMVTSKLNEAGLRYLSDQTAGIYVRSTAITPNLAPVANRVRELVPAEHEGGSERRPIERYQLPLFVAILLLLIRLFIGERRREARPVGVTGAVAILCLALGGMTALAPAAAAQNAPAGSPPPPPPLTPLPAVKTGSGGRAVAGPVPEQPAGPEADAAKAAQAAARRDAELRKSLTANDEELAKATPEHRGRLQFNRGFLQQQLGSLDEAEKAYQAALDDPLSPPVVRGQAYQNLGTVKHARARDQLAANPDDAISGLKSAAGFNREAMRLLPQTSDTARNQEILLREQKVAEQIKQMADKLKSQMQKAADETGKALEQQKQANEAKSDAERQMKQEQAAQQAQKAQNAASALAKTAEQAMGQEAAQPFQEIQKEIAQAQQAQKQAQQEAGPDADRRDAAKQAAELLKSALTKLGGKPQDPKDSKPGDEQAKKDQEKKDQQAQKKSDDKKDGQPQGGEPQGAPPPDKPPDQTAAQAAEAAQQAKDGDKPIDEAQAAAILRQVQAQEKNLREALKDQRRDNRLQPVEKDW